MVAGATIPYLLHKMCTQWAGLLNSSPFDLSKYNINLSTYIEVNFRLQVSKTLAFNYEILHRFGNSFILYFVGCCISVNGYLISPLQ